MPPYIHASYGAGLINDALVGLWDIQAQAFSCEGERMHTSWKYSVSHITYLEIFVVETFV